MIRKTQVERQRNPPCRATSLKLSVSEIRGSTAFDKLASTDLAEVRPRARRGEFAEVRGGPQAFTLIELSKTVRQGFTLIELLVVVTIIVVLLALLVPSMDKAVYQAELAACGAHLHGIGVGALSYAAEHQRHYPLRLGVHYNRPSQPTLLAGPPVDTKPGFDDRHTFKPYMGMGIFLDPLAKKVDLDSPTADSTVYGGYALWFGWQFNTGTYDQLAPNVQQRTGQNLTGTTQYEKGMFRIGDHFAWQSRRFKLLASDADAMITGDPAAGASHPDHEGVMANVVSTGARVFSIFSRYDDFQRPTVDHNFLSDDGSVFRLLTLGNSPQIQDLHNTPPLLADERLSIVPIFHDAQWFPRHMAQIPHAR